MHAQSQCGHHRKQKSAIAGLETTHVFISNKMNVFRQPMIRAIFHIDILTSEHCSGTILVKFNRRQKDLILSSKYYEGITMAGHTCGKTCKYKIKSNHNLKLCRKKKMQSLLFRVSLDVINPSVHNQQRKRAVP